MTRHVIRARESLADLATAYQLSGWQGLYFADANRSFRVQFPDPWCIPEGAEISIPQTSLEQFQALELRRSCLQTAERQVMSLSDRQRQLLGVPSASTRRSIPQTAVGNVIYTVVSTTIEAIDLLKAPDWRGTNRDLDLAADALERWDPLTIGAPAFLLTMLTRAAKSVPWSVSSATAQAWCDPSAPQFWAIPLVTRQLPNLGTNAPQRPVSIHSLLSAQRLAVEQLVRQLRSMRTEAIMETNHLARLRDGPA